MSATKFPVGSWECLFETSRAGGDHYIVVIPRKDDGDRPYETILSLSGRDHDAAALARLISAAPDLYAAVEASVNAYDELVASLGDDELSGPAPGILDLPDITIARAALSKARGETP